MGASVYCFKPYSSMLCQESLTPIYPFLSTCFHIVFVEIKRDSSLTYFLVRNYCLSSLGKFLHILVSFSLGHREATYHWGWFLFPFLFVWCSFASLLEMIDYFLEGLFMSFVMVLFILGLAWGNGVYVVQPRMTCRYNDQ